MAKQATGSETAARPYTVALENRASMGLTGVREVLAFDEKQISLQTEGGEMTISGEGLHVTTLLLEEGRVSLEGQIDSIVYANRNLRTRKGLRSLLK